MNAQIMNSKRNVAAAILVLSMLVLASCTKDVGVCSTEKTEGPTTKAAALAFTDNFQFPYEFTIFIPCANGGVGEDVTFSGTLHALSHLTLNGNSFTFKSHFQPQGIKGIGAITGDEYNATGVTQSTESGSLINGSYTFSYVNNFKLIGPGPDNNFYDHDTFKVTVNANGTVTVLLEKINLDCK